MDPYQDEGKRAVRELAMDLVKLYAARQESEGYVCGPDTVWQREFEEMFPYEETQDQLDADRSNENVIWKVQRSWIDLSA